MSDLTDRLRYAATSRPGGICEEAADEIERLRADAERYRWMRDIAWNKNALDGLLERYGPFEWDDAIDDARGEK